MYARCMWFEKGKIYRENRFGWVDEWGPQQHSRCASPEKGEGRRSQRVVGADGFEHVSNLDGERESLKEVFTEDSQSERECTSPAELLVASSR